MRKVSLIRSLTWLFITLLTYALSLNAYAQSNTTTPPDGGSQACGNMDECLNSIVQNTYQALVRLNNVPEQLKNISTTALSWIAKDDTQSTTDMQTNFAKLGSTINSDLDAQLGFQNQFLINTFANGDASAFTSPSPQNPKILNTIPNLNDLAYTTLLGSPPIPKANNVAMAPFNYVQNAAGSTIEHPAPKPSPTSDATAFKNYFHYYSSTMAVQSFNAYVLSSLLAERQNGGTISQTQKSLISQASSSDWIAQIASEDLGKVLRQLLMFQSQSYVLLTQLVKMQREHLSAQIMTNTLLILNNQSQEALTVPKALGTSR